MIQELHIFGIYMPAALGWGVVALFITFLLRGLLLRLPLHHLLWHPALLELTLFLLLWWGIASLADSFLPRGFIS